MKLMFVMAVVLMFVLIAGCGGTQRVPQKPQQDSQQQGGKQQDSRQIIWGE